MKGNNMKKFVVISVIAILVVTILMLIIGLFYFYAMPTQK
jgi:hypothetical protein